MEPISLTVGAIALASLLSTCIEFIDYFTTARSLAFDVELLLVKLDVEKERLLTWADLVGLMKTAEQGRSRMLDDKHELIHRCLSSIHTLFIDAAVLKDQYGVKPDSVTKTTEVANRLSTNQTTAFRRLFARVRGLTVNGSLNLEMKTTWAIFDKDKFTGLINHLRDLVDGLHNAIPVVPSDQYAIVINDIAKLSLHEIKLVHHGCEGTYRAWSEVANTIIVASEAGTFDHRSIQEWIQDTKPLPYYHDASQQKLNMSVQRIKSFDISLSAGSSIYFVFTSKCLQLCSGKPCSTRTIGRTAFGVKPVSFLPGRVWYSEQAKLFSRRIVNSMQAYFEDDDFEMLRAMNFELGVIQSAIMGNKLLPLAVVYIYCAPCGCALQSALSVSQVQNNITINSLVRVDDRIDSSCCSQQDRLDFLRSILDVLKILEATEEVDMPELFGAFVHRIDRLWLEQRIYNLEEKLSGGVTSETRIQRGSELIGDLQPQIKGKKCAFLIIGELDTCQWMLQNPAFPWNPRIARETEIYQLRMGNYGDWERIFLGTYTPRDYQLTSKSSFSRTIAQTASETIQSLSQERVSRRSVDSTDHYDAGTVEGDEG